MLHGLVDCKQEDSAWSIHGDDRSSGAPPMSRTDLCGDDQSAFVTDCQWVGPRFQDGCAHVAKVPLSITGWEETLVIPADRSAERPT